LKNICRIIGSALILMPVFAGITARSDPGDFSIRFGLGYDFVSQEYFTSSSRYDTSLTADPDLTDVALLSKDYLDDKKGLVYLKIDPKAEGRYIFEAGWEQTPEMLRAVGWGHIVLGNHRNRLETDLNFEIKDRYNGEPDAGEELSIVKGKVRYAKKLSETIESSIRIYAENVAFDSTGSFIYDYSRVGSEAGFNILSRGFNSVFFSAGIEKRNVPDSGLLDYTLVRANLGYFGLVAESRISVDLTAENKDFNSPDNQNDYLLTTLYGDLKIPADPNYFLKPLLSLEYFNFKNDDYVNDDYVLAGGGLLLGRDYDRLSIAVGPKIELHSIATDFDDDDDYLEYLIFGSIDLLYSDRILCLFENQIGRRGYKNDPLYYSDFTFDRISLIGSFKIAGALNFDLLLSAEWEWHEIKADDNRFYLLSSGLNYTF